ncbi:MAG: ATP-binding protein [Deltaproteobacteria bacterium]|nr:ATP-binding protein [Deltaproteobacteria bacterium]
MIHRLCSLPKKQSFFLFGPRQTGKSTLIESIWREHVWHIDLLHYEEFLKYSKAPDLFRREAIQKINKEKISTIFVDEIQRVPLILNEVHSLMESVSCQFILSGSSARKLKRGGANLLAGRAIQRFLFPFIYQEIHDEFDLEDCLRFGSLPAIYKKTEREKIDILTAYTETYLKEEIQAEGLVRNLGGFSRFLEIASAQSGELVDFTALGREAQLTARTVQSYYEILEETLIGLRLPPWKKSVRKRLTAHPKFYFFDTGVTNSLNRRLLAPPDPLLRGRLFEQWVILETHRLLSYKQSEARLFYWRTNTGAEVDLLIEKHGKIVAAFEIKASRSVNRADLSGLRSFSEDYSRTKFFAISNVPNAYEIDAVLVLPWQEYLESLEQFL